MADGEATARPGDAVDGDTGDGEFVYERHPELYDRAHATRDYVAHARTLRALLTGLGVPDGARVLEAACGTGRYLDALRTWYTVSGFDRSGAMLGLARARGLEDVFVADMRTFTMDSPQDVVLCLCSAVGYLRSVEELRAAFSRFASALRPGGLVVIWPWLEPEQAHPGARWLDQWVEGASRGRREARLVVQEGRSVLEFRWQIEENEGVREYVDVHVLALHPRGRILAVLAETGFEPVEVGQALDGQRLVVGRRRGWHG